MRVTQIRASRPEDGSRLREIERLAGAAFRSIGMASVADSDPLPESVLGTYAMGGRSWVAVDQTDRPVGYVIVDVVDGNAHVEQISVVPEFQGQGVSRHLLERVRTWAVVTGRRGITLTTFADVPWNGPLYEHLGFVVLSENELGPGLQAVRQREADSGLDPATRICMRLATDVMLVDQS